MERKKKIFIVFMYFKKQYNFLDRAFNVFETLIMIL